MPAMNFAVAMLLLPAVLASDGHDHGSSETESCACAGEHEEAPFTIDCDDVATINAATLTLETTCKESSVEYEWGGAFQTPSDAYKWVSQAVDGEYADPEMKLVIFAVDTADDEHLLEMAATANELMAGSCAVVETAGSIAAPTSAGTCYTLTFPTDASVDFTATVSTSGVSNVAFFTAHVPTEFERDTHYFMSTDLETDIEPEAETDAEEYNCKLDSDASGLMVCAQAFFIIQSHHDYCPHDTLTRYEEELFHEWEGKCNGCSIVRKYDAALKDCPVIDCSDTTVAELGYEHLHETCVEADTSYPFEWAATFDTPDDTYTWVSQAATASPESGSGATATGYEYADATMMVVAIAMSTNVKSALFALKDTADTLMSSSCSTEVTATCTPGDTSCSSMPTITPTTDGVCVTVRFPDSSASLVDFMASVDTSSTDVVAFFTAHLPTEFERDTHYFMSTDLATDIEPVSTLGEAAAHDHGRRLSNGRRSNGRRLSMNDRRSKRRLADPGMCCNTSRQQGAWKQVVSYHDLCDYNEVPEYIEIGFHDYEASCEDYFCNLIGPEVDQTVCPSPLSPPEAGVAGGVVAAIAIVALVFIFALGFGLVFLVAKEKEGKPIFTNVDGKKEGFESATTTQENI